MEEIERADDHSERLLEESPPADTSELVEICRGAWPQTVVIFCRTLITVTDTAVLGRLGTDELAAAAFANTWIQLTGAIIWSGCGEGMISLTSQAMGAENKALTGLWLQTSMVGALFMCVPIGISWFFIGDILEAVNMPTDSGEPISEIIRLSSVYGKMSIMWLLPDAATCVFCQWLNGLDVVKRTVVVHIFFVLYNLVANIVFVHGIDVGMFQFEGIGFEGSPLATFSTTLLRLMVLVLTMRNRLPAGVYNGLTLESIRFDRLSVFLGQAIPNAMVSLLEQLQFVVLTLLMASFGKDQLAAHSSMMNVFDLFTAGIFGMSEGGAMKIGNQLGAGRPKAARALSRVLFIAMGIMAMFVTLLFLGFRNYIGKIFSKDDQVIEYISQLAILVGMAYLLLTITFASYATLQGQGRPEKAVLSMFFGGK